MKNKKGFTLIELLMTVLIVAVLSAVAFPQYTKALERSRATEAMAMIKGINDSIYAFAAGRSNGACPETFQKLSITLPVSNDNVSSISLKNFRYDLKGATNARIPGTNCFGATATRIHGGDYDYVIWNPYRVRTPESARSRLGCTSLSGRSEKSKEVCESLGLYEEGETPFASGEPLPVSPRIGLNNPEIGDSISLPRVPTTPVDKKKSM